MITDSHPNQKQRLSPKINLYLSEEDPKTEVKSKYKSFSEEDLQVASSESGPSFLFDPHSSAPEKKGFAPNGEFENFVSDGIRGPTKKRGSINLPSGCRSVWLGDSNLRRINKRRLDRTGVTEVRTLPGTDVTRLTTLIAESGSFPEVGKVVLSVGTNDVNPQRISADSFKKRYKKLIDTALSHFPNAQVAVTAIPPQTQHKYNRSICELNDMLSTLDCTFINLGNFWDRDGNIASRELLSDKVHLSAKGVGILVRDVKTFLYPNENRKLRTDFAPSPQPSVHDSQVQGGFVGGEGPHHQRRLHRHHGHASGSAPFSSGPPRHGGGQSGSTDLAAPDPELTSTDHHSGRPNRTLNNNEPGPLGHAPNQPRQLPPRQPRYPPPYLNAVGHHSAYASGVTLAHPWRQTDHVWAGRDDYPYALETNSHLKAFVTRPPVTSLDRNPYFIHAWETLV